MSDSNPAAECEEGIPIHLSLTAGFLMGIANAIPGVSASTLALIIGIYGRFINALSTVIHLPIEWWRHRFAGAQMPQRKSSTGCAFRLLLPLLGASLVSNYIVMVLLVGQSDDPGYIRSRDTAPYWFAFFFGMVMLSVVIPWKEMESHRLRHYLIALLAAVFTAFLASLPFATNQPPSWTYPLGGAAAIAGMLLPGVSGSLLLMVFGQYSALGAALAELDILTISLFVLGIIPGVAGFIPILRYFLRKHHDDTMAALTGLMGGSLLALWPWKANYDVEVGPMTNVGVGDSLGMILICALFGAMSVYGLLKLEERIQSSSNPFSPVAEGEELD